MYNHALWNTREGEIAGILAVSVQKAFFLKAAGFRTGQSTGLRKQASSLKASLRSSFCPMIWRIFMGLGGNASLSLRNSSVLFSEDLSSYYRIRKMLIIL